jgi:hypothetical protein
VNAIAFCAIVTSQGFSKFYGYGARFSMMFFQGCWFTEFLSSDVVRTALDLLSSELARQRLRESADLYAEIYDEDSETQEWTNAALSEWPE